MRRHHVAAASFFGQRLAARRGSLCRVTCRVIGVAPARRTLARMAPRTAARRLRLPGSGRGSVSRASVVLVLAGLLLALASGIAGAQSDGGPVVEVLEVEGVIDQTISDYVTDVIDHANETGAEVVVMQLDTPGGLGESMTRITRAIERSQVPVVVWVGPAGAQAASAGVFIGYSAHVLAMAPGTTIGAATPVDLQGGDVGDKVVNDAASFAEAVAEARGRDVVIVDTAGRLHTQVNLMEELAKVRRVIAQRLEGAPHETLLVVDATTGQNGLQQARLFGQAVDVSGVALTKLDGTAKGGIAIAIAHELGLPVKLVGVGESLDDLQPFDARDFARALVSGSA